MNKTSSLTFTRQAMNPRVWITVWSIIVLGWLVAGLFIGREIAHAQAPAPVLWFKANAGSTNCAVYKTPQPLVHLSWTCNNAYGSTSGSYTASATNLNGGNYMDVELASITAIPSPNTDSSLRCTVQMNGTPNAMTMINGQVVPANSAGYNCIGFSTSGPPAVISWP